MPDVFSQQKRSEVMARIRGSGNRDTELRLIGLFRKYRISGWRRHWPLFGHPDFVFPKLRLVVFVDGCFWHGCPRHFAPPKTRQAFWHAKITGNKTRDRKVSRFLRSDGWQVLRLWEHDLVLRREERTLARLNRAILGCTRNT
jgi:DNA mismatch endonuclease (patch repair protein)